MPVDYHGWTHRPKALGGTDPIEVPGGVDYCYMSWQGPETVTVNTLLTPSALAGLDYEEGFSLDATSAFSLDLNTGIVSCNASGWYLAEAWAQFNGGATLGSELGIALDYGNSGSFSTYRVGNSIVATAINETMRIPVSRTWLRFNDTNHDSVRLLVWHDDAGGLSLNSAWLSVSLLTDDTAGTFIP